MKKMRCDITTSNLYRTELDKVKTRLAFIFLFLSGFLWMRFLTANLPLAFGDDMQQLQTAVEVRWPVLLRLWLTPLSPAWYIPSTGAYLTTRVFETVLLKLIFMAGGYDAELFHVIKDLAFAGVGLGVCGWTWQITRRLTLGFFSAWLFYLSPFVYQSACWISDFELVSQLLLLVSATCFLKIYSRERSWKIFTFALISAWWGFKTRESAKMLPLIFLVFLFWEYLKPLERPHKLSRSAWLLTGILFLLILPSRVQPISPSLLKDKEVLHAWDLVAGNRHVQELFTHPFTWLIFFVVAVLSAIFPLYLRRATRHLPQEIHANPQNDLTSLRHLRFACVWFGVVLISTFFFQTYFKWRYLSIFWVPTTILAASLAGRFMNSSHDALRKLGVAAYFGFFLYGAAGIYYTFYLRNHMSIKDTAAFRIARVVYQDRFRHTHPGQRELVDYYLGRVPAGPEEFDGMRLNEWDVIYDRNIPPSEHENVMKERLLSKFYRWGRAYLATSRKRGFEIPSGARYLGSVSGSSDNLFARFMLTLGHQFPTYDVYVWDARPAFDIQY